jgi:hypothetical protein
LRIRSLSTSTLGRREIGRRLQPRLGDQALLRIATSLKRRLLAGGARRSFPSFIVGNGLPKSWKPGNWDRRDVVTTELRFTGAVDPPRLGTAEESLLPAFHRRLADPVFLTFRQRPQ